MPFIPESKIQEILLKTDIVDIIGDYIKLTASGRSFKAVCPFHDDHEPSLSVSREKQIFKCFSCGEGGNAITFVQKYNNISFAEAAQIVGEKAGIKIDSGNKRIAEETPQNIADAVKLLKEVEKYAAYTLHTEEGKEALAYLYHRNFSDDTIRKFNIGFVPSSDKLLHYLNAKGYSHEQMKAAGVMDDKGHTFMNNRISFPVADSKGNINGFSCRAISSDNKIKYINSSESEVFQKGKVLFNYDRAAAAVKNRREVIVMEGQGDVIKSAQTGIDNSVSAMGTAMTKEQIQLLKQLHVPVKLCYDGDSAGINATLKNYQLLKTAGIEVRALLLPNGMDPDEVIEKEPDLFKKMLSSHDSIFDYTLKMDVDLDSFEAKEKYTMFFIKELHQMHNELAEEHYLSRLSLKTGFSEETLQRKLHALKAPEKPPNMQIVRNRSDKSTVWKPGRDVKINIKVKDKMDFRSEVKNNYDRLRESGEVITFDRNNVLRREDLLKKYIDLKGSVFETTITMLHCDQAEYASQSIAETVSKEVSRAFEIPETNLEYVGFFHKDTKYPHMHLQFYQKEPYLSKYGLTSRLVDNIKATVMAELEQFSASVETVAPAVSI